jgi:adenylate kinase
MRSKLIYLTGAPSSGKKATCDQMAVDKSVRIFSFGKEMLRRLNTKRPQITMNDMRTSTLDYVDPDDIKEIDKKMRDFCSESTEYGPVIINSLHVNRERYGLSISPFEPLDLSRLGVSEIWVFSASNLETARRAKERILAGGGSEAFVPKEFEIERHAAAVMALALNYAALAGVRLRVFDSDGSPEKLAELCLEILWS